uniref:Uncharacterized protein n=1 Tax=Solanum lycopersicum TaxID=4081 RepID=A0A3Q7H7W9_SOLLC
MELTLVFARKWRYCWKRFKKLEELNF